MSSERPTPEQIRATVNGYVAAYKANDRDALLALFAPDAEWIDPVGTPAHHGREGVGKFWDDTRTLVSYCFLRQSSRSRRGGRICHTSNLNGGSFTYSLTRKLITSSSMGFRLRAAFLPTEWNLERLRPCQRKVALWYGASGRRGPLWYQPPTARMSISVASIPGQTGLEAGRRGLTEGQCRAICRNFGF